MDIKIRIQLQLKQMSWFLNCDGAVACRDVKHF